ncbi:hypothetical protein Hanom_Chr10g00963611 [Helianthus anomalus]
MIRLKGRRGKAKSLGQNRKRNKYDCKNLPKFCRIVKNLLLYHKCKSWSSPILEVLASCSIRADGFFAC